MQATHSTKYMIRDSLVFLGVAVATVACLGLTSSATVRQGRSVAYRQGGTVSGLLTDFYSTVPLRAAENAAFVLVRLTRPKARAS